MPPPSVWARRIRALVRHHGWSLREASRQLGFSHSAIANYLRVGSAALPHRRIRESVEAFERQQCGALETRFCVTTKDCGLYFDACVSLHSGDAVLSTGVGVGRTRELAVWAAVRDLRQRGRVTLAAPTSRAASTSPSA